MKRGSRIITAVGISCVLEVLFLFCSYVQTINAPDWLWLVFTALHLVFIIGLGVFFFRSDNWRKASMETRLIQWLTFLLGTPIAGLLGLVACLTFVILLDPPSDSSKLVAVLFLAVSACVLYLPLRLVLRNRYTLGKELAVEQWVRERRSQSLVDRKRRLRAIRIASAIPACLGLIVYVFFFQCLAFAFLVAGSPKCDVGGYEFTAPASWALIFADLGGSDGYEEYPGIDALSGCNLIHDLRPLRRCTVQWSLVQRRTPPTQLSLSFPEISEKKTTAQNPHEMFQCTERWGFEYEPKNRIEISCDAPSLLSVHFFGPRDQAEQFYSFVRGMSWRQNP